jgi:dynein heavy chain
MYELSMEVPAEVQEAYWETYHWPTAISNDLSSAKLRLKSSRTLIESKILTEVGFLEESLQAIRSELNYFENLKSTNRVKEVMLRISHAQELIDSTVFLAQSIIKQSDSIHGEKRDENELEPILETFNLHKSLWYVIQDVDANLRTWANQLFYNLDSALITAKVTEWTNILSVCESEMNYDLNARSVLLEIKEELDDFWRNTRIVVELRNPALKETHWTQISSIIGIQFENLQDLTLIQILEYDLELVQGIISDIVNQAKDAYHIDLSLEKMKIEVSKIEFELEVEPKNDLSIFKDTQFAIELFQDQLITCEKLCVNVNDPGCKKRFDNWTSKLHNAIQIMGAVDELCNYMRRFSGLDSLVQSATQFTTEQKNAYNTLQRSFQKLSEVFSKNPKFTSIQYRSDLLEISLSCRAKVEVFQKGLTLFLANQREKFPRFFFLPDSDVLAFSNSRTPLELSSRISKVFAPCFKLIESFKLKETPTPRLQNTRGRRLSRSGAFQRTNLAVNSVFTKLGSQMDTIKFINGVISHDGETLNFERPVEMTDDTCVILKGIDSSIKDSVRMETKNTYNQLKDDFLKSFLPCLESRLLQPCLLAAHMVWNEELTIIGRKKDKARLLEFKNQLIKLFDILGSKLRFSELTSITRLKLEASMIKVLYFINCCENFGLIQVPNFMFQIDGEFRIQISFPGTRSFRYGFEYLGLEARKFVSDDMLKIYQQMFQAISENKAPIIVEPPESYLMQELAWILGYSMKSYHSNFIEPNFLKRLLEGQKKSDVWVVLRDISKLPLDSTAVWDANIEDGLIQHGQFLKLPVVGTISSMATLNRISNATKQRFKFLGTFKPDLFKLLEVQLQVNGFSNAQVMARKCQAAFDSISSICTTSPRSNILKSILELAAELRHNSPQLQELVIIKQSMLYFLRNSISSQDLGFLKDILNSFFKIANEERTVTIQGVGSIGLFQSAASKLNLVPNDITSVRVFSFFKMCELKNSIIVLGDICSGKSALWKICLEMANSIIQSPAKVKEFHAFPNAISFSNPRDAELRVAPISVLGGVLDKAYSHAAEIESKIQNSKQAFICNYSWVIFDGDVDNSWLDVVQSELEEKEDTYETKEMIQLVYEMSSISKSTPAFVTKSPIIYVESSTLKLEMLLSYLIHRCDNPSVIKSSAFIQIAFQICLSSSVKHLKSQGFLPKNSRVERFAYIRTFRLLECLVSRKGIKSYERMTTEEQYLWLFFSIIFATIWVVGADFDSAVRTQFSEYFRGLLSSTKNIEDLEASGPVPKGFLDPAIKIPQEGTIFEYIMDDRTLRWKYWQPHGFGGDAPSENFVPTSEFCKLYFFFEVYARREIPILINGPASSGKSAFGIEAMKQIARKYPSRFMEDVGVVCLTSHSTSKELGREVSGFFPFKRKDARGIPSGKTKIIFIDDLNTCNNQGVPGNPTEFLRMLLSTSFWYSPEAHCESLENHQFICTLTSTNIRHEWKSRWCRYLSLITIDNDITCKFSEIARELLFSGLKPFRFSKEEIEQFVCDLPELVFGSYNSKANVGRFKFCLTPFVTFLGAILSFPPRSYRKEYFYNTIVPFTISHLTNMENHRELNNSKIIEGNFREMLYIPPEIAGDNGPWITTDYQDISKELFKRLPLNFSQVKLKGIENSFSIEFLCRCAFAIQSLSVNFIFSELVYRSTTFIVEVVAHLTNRELFSFTEFINQNAGSDAWIDMIKAIKSHMEKSRKPVLLYIKSKDLHWIPQEELALLLKFDILPGSGIKANDGEKKVHRSISTCLSLTGDMRHQERLMNNLGSVFSHFYLCNCSFLPENAILSLLNEIQDFDSEKRLLIVNFLRKAFMDSIKRLNLANQVTGSENFDPDAPTVAISVFLKLYRKHTFMNNDSLKKIEKSFHTIDAIIHSIAMIESGYKENAQVIYPLNQGIRELLERNSKVD